MNSFDKPAFSISLHISQWEARGLNIPDRPRAERYLSVISAYTLPFQSGNPEHEFKENVNFEDILSLYVFDRRPYSGDLRKRIGCRNGKK